MSHAPGSPPPAAPVLAGLKRFQQRTVEYAFRRLFLDADASHRFLVADEVGLGKTMIARGVIAKAVEHLWGTVDRIDVVYVCSNADIARQNIRRLRSDQSQEFASATRATLLPIELRVMKDRRVNYVSMTPGTSLDARGGMGIARERALLYHLLRDHWGLESFDIEVLRGTVAHDNFKKSITNIAASVIDAGLRSSFIAELDRLEGISHGECKPSHRDRFRALADGQVDPGARSSSGDPRRFLIADLRSVLGRVCIKALRPDLVILDEFQRFKHLLDASNEDAELAHALFAYADERESAKEAVRVLLLSATPYRMYSQAHEAESQGDHYEDFVATYDFLVRQDPQQSRELRQLLRDYRSALLRVEQDGMHGLSGLKHALETKLRRVMARTERLAATADRSGMLREVAKPTRLEVADVQHYLAAAKVATALQHGEVVEYWKSAPYLLNFMDEYELKRDFREAVASGKASELAVDLAGAESGLLAWEDVVAYRRIDPANARLRCLIQDTVDQGLWRLLWLPPSLPYYRSSGPFAGVGPVTKRLVFSAWQVVPKAIASLVSHEVERRMMASAVDSAGVRNSPEGRKKIAVLLRFARSDGRLTGMPVLGLIYPSLAIASALDPVAARQPEGTAADMLQAARAALGGLLEQAKARWCRGSDPDERWYWAAPILLDVLGDAPATKLFWWQPELAEKWAGEGEGGSEAEESEGETAWAEHVRHARDMLARALRPDGLKLGVPPADLLDVLAKECLASPAVTSLRALGRVLGWAHAPDVEVRLAASRVAWRFRSLFNLPEVTAMLRGGDAGDPYWCRVLDYSVDGCLQAVLDEYVHVAADSLSVRTSTVAAAAHAIAEEMVQAIGLRTAAVGVDRIRVRAETSSLDVSAERMRARFAARFGQQKGDGSEGDRAGQVRAAFNSPFWPFVLASTSVGQEGLDFHQYCHAVVHWNLPTNPVDLEQREGRVHRFKGHAVRKNVARAHGDGLVAAFSDPWQVAFDAAAGGQVPGSSEMVPYWVFTVPDGAVIERHVPTLPLSRDADRLVQLRSALALYRMVFGQSRQEELVKFLQSHLSPAAIAAVVAELRIDLEPPPLAPQAPALAGPAVSAAAAAQVEPDFDLLAMARDVVLAHPGVVPLGCLQSRMWPFVPATWPLSMPEISVGKGCERSWWLMMCFDEVEDGSQLALCLLLTPVSDQPLRERIVERLLRDESEFGLKRSSLINSPGNPKHWVFLARRVLAPMRGHGLAVDAARQMMVEAVDDYARRFHGLGAAVWSLLGMPSS